MRIRSTDILFGLPALELRRLLQRVDAWDGFDAALLIPAATPPDQLARRRSAKMLVTSAMFSFPQMHSGTSASARLRPSGVSA